MGVVGGLGSFVAHCVRRQCSWLAPRSKRNYTAAPVWDCFNICLCHFAHPHAAFRGLVIRSHSAAALGGHKQDSCLILQFYPRLIPPVPCKKYGKAQLWRGRCEDWNPLQNSVQHSTQHLLHKSKGSFSTTPQF